MPVVTPPLVRRQYPNLREEESRLLRGYIQEQGVDRVDQLRTQMRVGQGEIIDDLPDNWRRMARDLSRWKIDAVIDWPGSTELIELKSRATHTAVGQLIGYREGLVELPGERSDPDLSVVAFRSHPDLHLATRRDGVRVHLLPHLDRTSSSR
jgi:hypothetical protein